MTWLGSGNNDGSHCKIKTKFSQTYSCTLYKYINITDLEYTEHLQRTKPTVDAKITIYFTHLPKHNQYFLAHIQSLYSGTCFVRTCAPGMLPGFIFVSKYAVMTTKVFSTIFWNCRQSLVSTFPPLWKCPAICYNDFDSKVMDNFEIIPHCQCQTIRSF